MIGTSSYAENSFPQNKNTLPNIITIYPNRKLSRGYQLVVKALYCSQEKRFNIEYREKSHEEDP